MSLSIPACFPPSVIRLFAAAGESNFNRLALIGLCLARMRAIAGAWRRFRLSSRPGRREVPAAEPRPARRESSAADELNRHRAALIGAADAGRFLVVAGDDPHPLVDLHYDVVGRAD